MELDVGFHVGLGDSLDDDFGVGFGVCQVRRGDCLDVGFHVGLSVDGTCFGVGFHVGRNVGDLVLDVNTVSRIPGINDLNFWVHQCVLNLADNMNLPNAKIDLIHLHQHLQHQFQLSTFDSNFLNWVLRMYYIFQDLGKMISLILLFM